ncbi:MAG: SHOCT domain-containing protein [Nitrosopumilus sp.]|uniref:SHOCT domain-containing protein n=1 Tax=Nitrosopumilus sp. TaxID=2024843 RepID=UPI00242A8CB5|nr:SHOCT domain-containing protein [Nitrosopumilus sp.]MCV0366811.1 SHOCT domain-containing protein [Nitrosopumilus sp.]
MGTSKKSKTSKKGGYIDKFLRRADKAIQEGIKKADDVLDEAVELGEITAKQASKASKEFSEKARKESEILQKKSIERINEGILSAKKMASSSEEDLRLLEKLGKLRKSGVLTEKEFQEKKKKILSRI